jgi:hypothetical protein
MMVPSSWSKKLKNKLLGLFPVSRQFMERFFNSMLAAAVAVLVFKIKNL